MDTVYKEVGRLTEIYFYPVKSCRGISITNGNCNVTGLDFDRHWVILDRGGRAVTLGSRNELALIVPTMLDDCMRIEAPGMQPLVIPLQLTRDKIEYIDVDIFGLKGNGVHVSNDADAWFSEYLQKPHTFVSFNASCKPRSRRDCKTFGNMPYVKDADCTAYAHSCAYHLISEESLVALNEQSTDMKFEMQRFRPNLVIEGCERFSEDVWKFIKIGDVVFRCLQKCGRCTLPNVDPTTGVRNKKEPLNSLRNFRMAPEEEKHLFKNSPVFGMNLAIDVPGKIKKGDIVYAAM